jgi:choline dehydrogenase-like flavoprotein
VTAGGTGYDVVVVGAGSAGAALAGRLSEDPSLRVLLLEAGGSDRVLEVQIPAALYKVWRTRRDWNYATDEQPGLGGRRLFWPRGKVLGGSSSINAMIYIRGARADYDEWARLTGDPTWSYEHVLPLFRRMEDNARGADEWHGVGGPLRVEDLRSPHPWTTAVVESAVAAGYPRNDDFNGATQEGVGQYQVTQRRGRRWSAADAYLHPAASRPNLTVLTGALATRVLVSGGRATGVEYRRNGALHTVRATSEVVLSGGAVNSPQLLMLSGIGPADHLREVGVDVVHDLPGVGAGLQDHPLVPVVFDVRSGAEAVPGGVAVGLREVVRRAPRSADLQPRRGRAVHPVLPRAGRARPAVPLPPGEVLEAGRGRPGRRRLHRRGRAGRRALARFGAAALGRPDVGAVDRRRLPDRPPGPRRAGLRRGEGPRDRRGRTAGVGAGR